MSPEHNILVVYHISSVVSCPHGQLMNVSGPRIFTAGEYGGSYKYGAWGRDPKPTAERSSWYWMVVMTTSNVFSNHVRLYSSLSALIVGLSTPGLFFDLKHTNLLLLYC